MHLDKLQFAYACMSKAVLAHALASLASLRPRPRMQKWTRHTLLGNQRSAGRSETDLRTHEVNEGMPNNEMPAIYALYIINKSGGLIYNKEFLPHTRVGTNDTLRLASMWHGLNEIAAQLAPVHGCTGIELLQADTFNLHCFQTLTDTKFVLVTDPNTPDTDALLRERIYDFYTDYVLKNPFYEMEMPIKCEQFDQKLLQHISTIHRRWGIVQP